MYFLQTEGGSDEQKRQQMEKLVREELERWDSESSMGRRSRPGSSAKGAGGVS